MICKWQFSKFVSDEDDNMSETQHLRNDRACKGRRYQEFKDQALGRKGSRNNSLSSRPGDRSSVDGMILTNLKNENSS